MKIRHSGRSRNGFTLTELLIAITVIGILLGMLSMAVIPALRTARETTIALEVQQLELALEQFREKYGFYPPSFETGATWAGPVGVSAWTDLIPYVRRISPNHAELTSSGVGTGAAPDGRRTRLEHWWIEIGQYLDQESSLVFWLSGVCRNKQYPITGGATSATGTPPLAAHSFVDDGIERELFYDFKAGQIIGDASDEIVKDRLGGLLPASVVGYIYEYEQPHGGTDEEIYTAPDGTTGLTDYRFKYRDAATYDIGGGNTAYYNAAFDPSSGTSVQVNDGIPLPPPPNGMALQYVFVNPKGFQLISFGMDGLAGAPGNCFAVNSGTVSLSGTDFFGPWGSDNICSFTDGRLDKFVNSQ